jgi:hypothetical protein
MCSLLIAGFEFLLDSNLVQVNESGAGKPEYAKLLYLFNTDLEK